MKWLKLLLNIISTIIGLGFTSLIVYIIVKLFIFLSKTNIF